MVVGAIYILLNLAYYAVLSPAQIRGTDSAAASATIAAFGSGATRFVSILIVVSILGAMNGTILTGPRVYYAMAREGNFLRAFGRLDRIFHAPSLAIAVQGLWAVVLIQLGTFQQLLTHVIFVAWIFYGLTVGGVMILHRKFPGFGAPLPNARLPCDSHTVCTGGGGRGAEHDRKSARQCLGWNRSDPAGNSGVLIFCVSTTD